MLDTISIHAAQVVCDPPICSVTRVVKISIHAAQEGCDCYDRGFDWGGLYISIHAAQEGCDIREVKQAISDMISIHAAGTAGLVPAPISIHAAQEGCDLTARLLTA